MTTEKDVESYLSNRVKQLNGRSYKWVSPGNNGVPDRIVFLKNTVRFVELKAPGKKPSSLQLVQHNRLKNLGFEVIVIDSKEKVDLFLKEVVQNG